MAERIVEFLRKKDLVYQRELGRGACGETVVLHDPVIQEDFVCKKYFPIEEGLKETLFRNFLREIKLLHLLNHINVVRVFNYYIYPERLTGYILMEYIKGSDIEDYLTANPDAIDEIFVQAVEGFSHLEERQILHRDIRPQNILVTDDGILKIIDFGFGKQTMTHQDFDKSVTLNWWCHPPAEFEQHVYDYKTEVYFVGKLFEKIITNAGIERFKYRALLAHMCSHDPSKRADSFADVRRRMLANGIDEFEFSESDLFVYRTFADALSSVVAHIAYDAKYFDDPSEVEIKLERAYRNAMLEEYVPNNGTIVSSFVNGGYSYRIKRTLRVSVLRDFLDFLRSCSRDRKIIVLSNIQTRLDTAERSKPKLDDDIPF